MINIGILVSKFLETESYKKFNGSSSIGSYGSFIKGTTSVSFSQLSDLVFTDFSVVSFSKSTTPAFRKYVKLRFGSPKSTGGETVKHKFMDYLCESISVCPYCGITPLIYRHNESGRKVYSFELDHFFPKADFPSIGLSLYNLVPTCKVCNQTLKKGIPFGKTFHPYFGILETKETATSYEVSLVSKSDLVDHMTYNFNAQKWETTIQDHIDFFKMDDAYKTSAMSKNDVMFAKKIYDKAKFYKLPVDKDSIDDLFENWTYDGKEDLLKHCNGKFRKDIIAKLPTLI